MPLVSVLTPTQAHNADHLDETWASLRDQRLPAGWEWEWVVQEDGAAPELRERLPADERIHYAALGVQAGAPATRNAALVRARGDLVGAMDHDDCYTETGLTDLVRALDVDGAGWACGRARLLQPDGLHTWEKPDVLPPGRVAPGAIGAYYLATNDWPFPAAFVLYRRQALLALGGWPALPSSDDAGLLLAYSHHHAGVWLDRAVAVYRRWDRQKSVQPAHWALREATREALRTRAEALGAAYPRAPAAQP